MFPIRRRGPCILRRLHFESQFLTIENFKVRHKRRISPPKTGMLATGAPPDARGRITRGYALLVGFKKIHRKQRYNTGPGAHLFTRIGEHRNYLGTRHFIQSHEMGS